MQSVIKKKKIINLLSCQDLIQTKHKFINTLGRQLKNKMTKGGRQFCSYGDISPECKQVNPVQPGELSHWVIKWLTWFDCSVLVVDEFRHSESGHSCLETCCLVIKSAISSSPGQSIGRCSYLQSVPDSRKNKNVVQSRISFLVTRRQPSFCVRAAVCRHIKVQCHGLRSSALAFVFICVYFYCCPKFLRG